MIRIRRALSKAAFPLGLQSGKGVAVDGDTTVDVGCSVPESVSVGVGVREGVAVTVDVLDGVEVTVGVSV